MSRHSDLEKIRWNGTELRLASIQINNYARDEVNNTIKQYMIMATPMRQLLPIA